MKQLTILLIAALFLLTASDCGNRNDDDEPGIDATGALELNFTGTFDGAPLTMYADSYDYADGIKVKFQLMMFYLSNTTALKASGEEVLLRDIALVSFEDIQSAEAAQAGIDFAFDELPAGEYTGIRFGIGVAPSLNAEAPAAYTPPHPLASNTHHWSAAGSYVYTKIEGNADTNSDGEFTEKLTYHIGADAMYREKTINTNFTIDQDAQTTVGLTMDVKKMMVRSETDFLDLTVYPTDHQQKPEVYDYLYTNLVNEAIQLK